METLERRLLELTGVVLADETLEAALGHVARVTVRAIPACDAAGVSVLERGRITTAAASVPLVHRLDAQQCAYARAREVIEQLQEALLSRDVIGQAKGIIQSREGCTPDEAFDRLRVVSQHRNVKLRDLAEALVEDPGDLVHG